jgi:hypothetical protein
MIFRAIRVIAGIVRVIRHISPAALSGRYSAKEATVCMCA